MRKRRRYGRRRNPLPVVLVVLLVAAVAVGAYLLHREDDGAGRVTQAARCPSAAPVPSPKAPTRPVALPAPRSVKLTLLNGTARSGLARTVGDELARRGFTVGGMGNAPRPLTGATVVSYGPGSAPAAQTVAAQLLGARIAPRPGAPGVEVTLGSGFARLRTPAEVAAYTRALLSPAPPAPAPAPSASRTCA
jgi:hypothetical protein